MIPRAHNCAQRHTACFSGPSHPPCQLPPCSRSFVQLHHVLRAAQQQLPQDGLKHGAVHVDVRRAAARPVAAAHDSGRTVKLPGYGQGRRAVDGVVALGVGKRESCGVTWGVGEWLWGLGPAGAGHVGLTGACSEGKGSVMQ